MALIEENKNDRTKSILMYLQGVVGVLLFFERMQASMLHADLKCFRSMSVFTFA